MTVLVIKHGGSSKREALAAAAKVSSVVVVDQEADADIAVPLFDVPDWSADAVVLALARHRTSPEACLTFVDPATVLTAEVADRLGGPGLPVPTALRLKDKLMMRRALRDGGNTWPRYQAVDDDAPALDSGLECPCVLKPVVGAYGLGVAGIFDETELRPKLQAARLEVLRSPMARRLAHNASSRWMAESYLQGLELSIEVLGHPDVPRIIAIHEKVVTESEGRFREDQFVTAPYRLSAAELRRVEHEAARACQLLGFVRGVGNLEARLTERGLNVIELQSCPTGGLVAGMVRQSHGVDLNELHVRSFLRREPIYADVSTQVSSCAMDILHAERPGEFRIAGIEQARRCQGVTGLQILRERGRVAAPHSEYLGFIVCEGATPDEAVDRLNQARHAILIEAVQ
jgi:biotin carboxylase